MSANVLSFGIMVMAVGNIRISSARHVFVKPYPISIPIQSVGMWYPLLAPVGRQFPRLRANSLSCIQALITYYFYLHILSRSIIFLVFLDAAKMNAQGIVIMRNVVRATKLADVRSTGLTPMRKQ